MQDISSPWEKVLNPTHNDFIKAEDLFKAWEKKKKWMEILFWGLRNNPQGFTE